MKKIETNIITTREDQSVGDMQEIFDDLAMMLWNEKGTPVWNREFFDGKNMNLTVDSLKHLDEYLLNAFDPKIVKEIDESLLRTFLRAGAYFGEVLSKNSIFTFEWIGYTDAMERNIEFPEPITPLDGLAFLHGVGNSMSLFPYTTVRKALFFRKSGRIISLHEAAEKILEILRAPEKVFG